MAFIRLLLAAAISLAAAAGYFSISGLSETYAASATSVIIMAVCLEFAKVILASFIHNYWNKTRFVFKTLSCFMLAILMAITSYGVFSHLIAAYQKDNVSLTDTSQQLNQDKTELARLVARKQQMDDQVAKLPNNYVRARTQLIKSFGSEYTDVPSKINQLNAEVTDLSTKQTATQAKIGPIIYLAKFLGQDPDITIIYFTAAITAVFDPLAILLVFAYNIALKVRRDDKQNKTGPPSHTAIEDALVVKEKEESKPEEPIYSPSQDFHMVVSKEEPAPYHMELDEKPFLGYGDEIASPAIESPPEPTQEESDPLATTPTENIIDRMYAELRNTKKPVN
jgi:cell division protein FtsB